MLIFVKYYNVRIFYNLLKFNTYEKLFSALIYSTLVHWFILKHVLHPQYYKMIKL